LNLVCQFKSTGVAGVNGVDSMYGVVAEGVDEVEADLGVLVSGFGLQQSAEGRFGCKFHSN
jgi:hypothetical protein